MRCSDRLEGVAGKQSGAEKRRLLTELLARCTTEEQDFVTMLAIGEVRQGALDGVLAEAVAQAASAPAAQVRRAVMLAGDLGAVAEALAQLGVAAIEWKLDGARIQV